MIGAYAMWKTLHILSATVLFGTGLGIAFFAWFGYRRAMRVEQIDGLRAVLRLTVIADSSFTAPAVAIQLLSGAMLMHFNRWSFLSPWSLTVLGLFALVGALWLPVVVLQLQLSREAQAAASLDALSDRFHRRFKVWFVLGVPAFVGVVILFLLMVAKPLSLASAY